MPFPFRVLASLAVGLVCAGAFAWWALIMNTGDVAALGLDGGCVVVRRKAGVAKPVTLDDWSQDRARRHGASDVFVKDEATSAWFRANETGDCDARGTCPPGARCDQALGVCILPVEPTETLIQACTTPWNQETPMGVQAGWGSPSPLIDTALALVGAFRGSGDPAAKKLKLWTRHDRSSSTTRYEVFPDGKVRVGYLVLNDLNVMLAVLMGPLVFFGGVAVTWRLLRPRKAERRSAPSTS